MPEVKNEHLANVEGVISYCPVDLGIRSSVIFEVWLSAAQK